jgi:effector-binding domain-containing protein
MSAAPGIVIRAEQPYMAIRERVTMAKVGGLGERFGDVFAWLGAHGMDPAGAPFFKYNVIDMMRELEIDVSVPVAAVMEGDGHVLSGVVPAGKYATLTHVGSPAELMGATKSLLDWRTRKAWDGICGRATTASSGPVGWRSISPTPVRSPT